MLYSFYTNVTVVKCYNCGSMNTYISSWEVNELLCNMTAQVTECLFNIVIRTDSLETRAELAVLRTYVENQAIIEPILLYRASKCKQT